MFSNHADMMLTQIAIGLCFTLLYFVVFRTLILQFNMCTPGREDAEVKLYSKAEYKASRGQTTAAEPKSWIRLPVSCKPWAGSAISPALTIARRVYVLHCMTCHKRWMTKSLKSWERTASSVVAMPFR